MEEENRNNKKQLKTPMIEDQDGINISYDKEEIKTYYPNLMSEISNKKKIIKIKSVEMKIEEKNNNQQNSLPKELINPRAIDFIRRCTKNEEAIEILDYLLKRNELKVEEYNLYKEKIMKKEGLKKLINESGGFKRQGYYFRKYYKEKKLKITKN